MSSLKKAPTKDEHHVNKKFLYNGNTLISKMGETETRIFTIKGSLEWRHLTNPKQQKEVS
jgi:hypothetical protein